MVNPLVWLFLSMIVGGIGLFMLYLRGRDNRLMEEAVVESRMSLTERTVICEAKGHKRGPCLGYRNGEQYACYHRCERCNGTIKVMAF